jgi:DNA-binding response OmpR family regulator
MKKDIKVLFVEDDPASVEFMVHALRASGFHPDSLRVDNARDFDRALRDRPDVIIADYYVPDFYGIDVLYLMHHGAIEVPVIVVSAALPENSEAQVLRLGAHDFVRKDHLGRLGTAVYDAMAQKSGSCRVADRPIALAETSGLV